MECEISSPEITELSLVIVDDAEMAELNASYRGKSGPTDVLSFSMVEGDGSELSSMLGDVVISIDTALRQATEQGVSPDEELLRLLVHGILHLVGYNHENVPEAEAQRMFDTQDELLESFLREGLDSLLEAKS